MTVAFSPAGAGVPPQVLKPGSFILTHGVGFVSTSIRVGQWLRFGHGYYNHAAGIVAEDGTMVEMLARGATVSHIDKYRPLDYHLFDPELTDDQAAQAVAFWRWCAEPGPDGGPRVRYNFAAFGAMGVRAATGAKFAFGSLDKLICSGMVAAGLPVWEWRPSPGFVYPIELGLRYGLPPGT